MQNTDILKPVIQASPMVQLFAQPLSGKTFPLSVRLGSSVEFMLGRVARRDVPARLRFRGKYLRTALPDDAQERECLTTHQWSPSPIKRSRHSSSAHITRQELIITRQVLITDHRIFITTHQEPIFFMKCSCSPAKSSLLLPDAMQEGEWLRVVLAAPLCGSAPHPPVESSSNPRDPEGPSVFHIEGLLQKRSTWRRQWRVRKVRLELSPAEGPSRLRWEGGAAPGEMTLDDGCAASVAGSELVLRSAAREIRFRSDASAPTLQDWLAAIDEARTPRSQPTDTLLSSAAEAGAPPSSACPNTAGATAGPDAAALTQPPAAEVNRGVEERGGAPSAFPHPRYSRDSAEI